MRKTPPSSPPNTPTLYRDLPATIRHSRRKERPCWERLNPLKMAALTPIRALYSVDLTLLVERMRSYLRKKRRKTKTTVIRWCSLTGVAIAQRTELGILPEYVRTNTEPPWIACLYFRWCIGDYFDLFQVSCTNVTVGVSGINVGRHLVDYQRGFPNTEYVRSHLRDLHLVLYICCGIVTF